MVSLACVVTTFLYKINYLLIKILNYFLISPLFNPLKNIPKHKEQTPAKSPALNSDILIS